MSVNDPQLTLVSTTDPVEAVQAALGVTPDAAAAAVAAATPAATAPVVETPAAPVAVTPAVEETPVAAAPVVETPKPGAKPRVEKGNSLQGRIDELVRERDTARGLTAAHEAELTALRAKVTELAGPTQPKVEPQQTTEAPPKPKVEDFPDYDAFMEASIQYHARIIAADQVKEALAAQATTTAQTQQQQAVVEVIKQHEARVEAAKGRYDDFAEVVGQPNINISTVMRDQIMISDVGPDVAYYLASHPDEREKIAALGNSPAAIRAMGKLEQKVETELAARPAAAASASVATTDAVSTPAAPTPAAEPAKPAPAAPAATRAPDPINPLGGGNVTTTVRPDSMSFADYKKWREDQLAARHAVSR